MGCILDNVLMKLSGYEKKIDMDKLEEYVLNIEMNERIRKADEFMNNVVNKLSDAELNTEEKFKETDEKLKKVLKTDDKSNTEDKANTKTKSKKLVKNIYMNDKYSISALNKLLRDNKLSEKNLELVKEALDKKVANKSDTNQFDDMKKYDIYKLHLESTQLGKDLKDDKITKEEYTKGINKISEVLAKIKPNTITINGIKIRFHSIHQDKNKPLAMTNRHLGILLQEDMKVSDVIDYLRTESVDSEVSDIVKVKQEVNKQFKSKYNEEFTDVLERLTNSEIRKFLLLHEYRHTLQIAKRKSFTDFMKEYKDDPVKFELDANEFALEQLGLVEEELNQEEEKKAIDKRKDSKITPEEVIENTKEC